MARSGSARERIAVIGGGIAGITAAHVLAKRHDVTLYEANAEVGGHANAVTVDDGQGGALEVDTAFLIYNRLHYPRFVAFLRELGVEDRTTSAEMSASFVNHDLDVCYALGRGIGPLFFQRRNLVRPAFYRIFADLLRFRRRAYHDVSSDRIPASVTLGDYLAPYSPSFVSCFVAPLACAIWSLPDHLVLRHPARQILRFFYNHGLLRGSSGDAWRTFDGASRVYVRAFLRSFRGRVRTREPVQRVLRTSDAVRVLTRSGAATFDRVVLATHADVSLGLLDAPTPEERAALGPWRYHPNEVLLHEDVGVLHRDRRLWASWNVVTRGKEQIVTYDLNRVQRLRTRRELLLTLGEGGVDPARVLARFTYRHPVFDAASVATHPLLEKLDGASRTFFCGSYAGHGFHEDAVVSALRVGARLGVGLGQGPGESSDGIGRAREHSSPPTWTSPFSLS
jgi:uncharacterized protein